MYKGKGLKRNTQAGFTLIEIAVVLVIIGLLIGGILQGTALIDNSKVKKAAGDFQAISAAYVSYQDRYQRLPGDDGPQATLRLRGGDWTNVVGGGNNNGALLVTRANTFATNGEGGAFWSALRAAGYISGDPTVAALPRNAFGGSTGVTSDPATLGTFPGVKICMAQVPGKLSAALDLQFDDGQPDAGAVRASVGTAGTNTVPAATAATAYDEGLE